ncbi:hypothetical protein ACW7G0_07465 [Lysobacter sp. A286]
MRNVLTAAMIAGIACATGCATYQAGGADRSATLKKFESIPDKGSVYVCRESALLVARGVKSEVYIDNENIGTLKVNSFVHTAVEPGKHGVLLRHDGMNHGAGGFETFEINPGEIRFFWVGVTGNGFGVLTVDDFETQAEARDCVINAEYSIPAPPTAP